MAVKTTILLITLLVGSLALPLNEPDDNSLFFDNTIVNPSIIGGETSAPVPHMAALTSGIAIGAFFCGGSIISNRHILTAAHCIDFVLTGTNVHSSVRARVGSVFLSSGGTEYSFSHGAMHPDYKYSEVKNDIGFLQTSSVIVFTNNVQPVALSFDFIGGNVPTVFHGWGATIYDGEASETLNELRPFTVDGKQCIEDMDRVRQELHRPSHLTIDPELEICTYLAVNHGTCHGDSGSALLDLRTNRQIGVVSWALPCALGAPDVFARVSIYQSWIQEILR